ncbi:MAG: hypothetical protein JSR58_06340 [Verrucomicrobia bacterium]|nr:hypothetical protein [Verrucomicrobiota bacterium]
MESSFSLYAFKQVMSSDWLYPSQCEQRAVDPQESLSETLSNIDLLNAKLINTNYPVLKTIVRYVARIFALALIGIFVAPIGILWHGLAITVYALKYWRGTSVWEKVEHHTRSFFNDLKIALCIGLPWYNIYQRNSRLFYLLALVTVTAAASRAKGVALFAGKNERVPLFKSIYLRREFGIVDKKREFLPYDLQKDQEDFANQKGWLFDVHKKAAHFLLTEINQIQSRLPENYNLFFEYPPNVISIIKRIKTWQDLKLEHPTPEFCQNHIDELESAQELYDETTSNLQQAYQMQDMLGGFLSPFIEQSHIDVRFPYTEGETRDYFCRKPVAQPQTPWGIYIKSTYEKIQAELKLANLENLSELSDFRDIVSALKVNSSAQQILGSTAEKPRGFFNKKALIVHQDYLEKKLPSSVSKEQKQAILEIGKLLLECLQKAKEEPATKS